MTRIENTPSRRRRRATDTWSASSTIEWLGPGNTALGRTPDTTRVPDGAVKAKVHYRYRGRSKKPTFTGPDLVRQITGFQALLTAAHAGDWPADAAGRPITPLGVPTATAPAAPGEDTPQAGTTSADTVDTTPAELLAIPGLATDEQVGDVGWLASWSKARHTGRKKKRGGNRRHKTTNGYANELDFFLAVARYTAVDRRCADGKVRPGDLWRLDDPELRVTEADLLRVLEVRATTDLRVRRSNQAALRRWAAAVEAEQRRADAAGRRPEPPPMPTPRPESASARTVESFARTVAEMFRDAFAHGLLDYQPWTARVEEEVPTAGVTSYLERTLPHRDQVAVLVATMRQVQLTARTPSGHRDTCSGDRHAALVWLATGRRRLGGVSARVAAEGFPLPGDARKRRNHKVPVLGARRSPSAPNLFRSTSKSRCPHWIKSGQ